MREVKYQAWVPHANAMRDVTALEFNHAGLKWVNILPSVPRDYRWGNSTPNTFKLAALKVQLREYIGRKDINGKEIYEGDILQYVSPEEYGGTMVETYEVVWKDCGFVGRWLQAKDEKAQWIQNALSDTEHDMEVIGNICENPELLDVS